MGLCASSPVASGRIDGDVVLTGVNKSDLTTIVAASLARSCGANIKMVAAVSGTTPHGACTTPWIEHVKQPAFRPTLSPVLVAVW